ncbi:MAG: PAS domain-containing protein [Chitinophagaceae bacterium]
MKNLKGKPPSLPMPHPQDVPSELQVNGNNPLVIVIRTPEELENILSTPLSLQWILLICPCSPAEFFRENVERICRHHHRHYTMALSGARMKPGNIFWLSSRRFSFQEDRIIFHQDTDLPSGPAGGMPGFHPFAPDSYQELFLDHPWPLMILDPDNFQIIAINRCAKRKWGDPDEDASFVSLRDLMNKMDARIWDKEVKKLGLGQDLDFSTQLYTPEGNWIPVEIRVHFQLFNLKPAILVVINDSGDKLRLELELRKSRERYKYATMASFDAIWDWNLISGDLTRGLGYQTLFGYEAGRQDGSINPWYEHVHPEDQERVMESLQRVIHSRNLQHWQNNYRFIRADGSIALVMDRALLLRDERHLPSRMIGAMQDITLENDYQGTLELLHTRLNAAQQWIKTGYWEMDPLTLKILYWSSEIYEILGEDQVDFSPSINYFLGKVHSEDHKRLVDELEAITSGKESLDIQFRFKGKDGKEKILQVYGNLSRNQQGEPDKWKGVLQDITELKSSHQLEEDYTRKVNTILESMGDGFFAVNGKGLIHHWNEQALEILGKNKEEIFHHLLEEIFQGIRTSHFFSQEASSKKSEKISEFVEYQAFLKKWLEVRLFPTEEGWSVYFRDISEKHRLQTTEHLERMVLEHYAQPNQDLSQLLEVFLEGIEGLYDGIICSVLEKRGSQLFKLAAPHLPKDFLEATEGLEVGQGRGSCGTAAYLKKMVVVTDIAHDPLWAGYTNLAERFGLKACWSFPVLDTSGEVLGTFAAYYRENRHPTPLEENMAERASHFLRLILEHKQSQEAIRLSKERYDLVARATNDVLWDLDLSTGQIVWNDAITDIFGYPRDAGLPNLKSWMDQIHPKERHLVHQRLQQQFKDRQESWRDEFRFKCLDGSYRYVLLRGIILFQDPGIPVRIIGALQDITQRKESVLKIASQEQRFRSLVQHGSDLIALLDPSGNYTYVSPTVTPILGYEPDFFLGKNVLNFIHPDDRETIGSILANITSIQRLNLEPFRFLDHQGQ